MDKAFARLVVVGVFALAVLAVLGLIGLPMPAFQPALESWTGWFASVVGIIVAARVLWTVAAWVQKKAGS